MAGQCDGMMIRWNKAGNHIIRAFARILPPYRRPAERRAGEDGTGEEGQEGEERERARGGGDGENPSNVRDLVYGREVHGKRRVFQGYEVHCGRVIASDFMGVRLHVQSSSFKYLNLGHSICSRRV